MSANAPVKDPVAQAREDVERLPGIDFNELHPCDHCHGPLTGSDQPKTLVFYRVTIEHAVVNVPAVQQFAGLTQFFGGHERLADVFAPNRHAAKVVSTRKLLLCLECAMRTRLVVE